MAHIKKEYFKLQKVIESLKLELDDIGYLAENGHIRLSALVFDVPIAGGSGEETVTGIIDLREKDAHSIISRGHCDIRHFGLGPDEFHEVNESAKAPVVSVQDLILRQSEVDRLSGSIIDSPTSLVDPTFRHDVGYRSVEIQKLQFFLGKLQANVVKQLHQAAIAGQPWQRGTDLLLNARCSSLRMVDLFKSKHDWRVLVQSDQCGNYRLGESGGADAPGYSSRF